MIIDGAKIAEKILKELAKQLVPEKEFAAILVGDDAASLSFLKQKEMAARSLGVKFHLYRFADTLAQVELQKKVHEIYTNPDVGAVIIQLPLPVKYDRIAVLNEIGIDKDVDVLNGETSKILAPAAGALKRILKEVAFDVADKEVVVVGSGLLIGRPIADWLMGKVKHVTIMNKGGYKPEIVRNADLVITGTGVPRLINGDHLKKGAVVIDYGYGRDESDTLSGDVDFKSASRVAGHITPTPGGTGPIVVAMLFSNFYTLVA